MRKIFVGLLALLAPTMAETTNTTVLPPGFENQNGNSQQATFDGALRDYQELFRASSTKWQTPVRITGVNFRVTDGENSSFDAVIPRIEIRLSTSQRSPEQMVSSYFLNRGPDETVVFSHDNVSLFARAGMAVNPFDLKFAFDRPFDYDPSQGNLFLYLANSGPNGQPGTRSLDANVFPSLANTPVASAYTDFFGVISPVSASGLIAQFEWVTIPEPRSIFLFSLGSLLFLTRLCRRRTLIHCLKPSCSHQSCGC